MGGMAVALQGSNWEDIMEYTVKATIRVSAQSNAEALKRLQDAVEHTLPKCMYIETVDKIEHVKGS